MKGYGLIAAIAVPHMLAAGVLITRMVTRDPRYADHAERSVYLFDGRIASQDVVMGV